MARRLGPGGAAEGRVARLRQLALQQAADALEGELAIGLKMIDLTTMVLLGRGARLEGPGGHWKVKWSEWWGQQVQDYASETTPTTLPLTMCHDPMPIPEVIDLAGGNGAKLVPLEEFVRLEGHRWASSWSKGRGSMYRLDRFGKRGEALLLPSFCRVEEPEIPMYVETGHGRQDISWLCPALTKLASDVDPQKQSLSELLQTIQNTSSLALVLPVAMLEFNDPPSTAEFGRRASRRCPFYIKAFEMGARLQISMVPPLKTRTGDPDSVDAQVLDEQLGAQLFSVSGHRAYLCVRRLGGPALDRSFAGASLEKICAYLTGAWRGALAVAPRTWARLKAVAERCSHLEATVGPVPGSGSFFTWKEKDQCDICGQPAVGSEVSDRATLAVCCECAAFVPGSQAFSAKQALAQHTSRPEQQLVGTFDSGLDDMLEARGDQMEDPSFTGNYMWPEGTLAHDALVLAVGGMLSLRPPRKGWPVSLETELHKQLRTLLGCRARSLQVLGTAAEAESPNILVNFLLLHPAVFFAGIESDASEHQTEELDPAIPLTWYDNLEKELRKMAEAQQERKTWTKGEQDVAAPLLLVSDRKRVILPCSLLFLKSDADFPSGGCEDRSPSKEVLGMHSDVNSMLDHVRDRDPKTSTNPHDFKAGGDSRRRRKSTTERRATVAEMARQEMHQPDVTARRRMTEMARPQALQSHEAMRMDQLEEEKSQELQGTLQPPSPKDSELDELRSSHHGAHESSSSSYERNSTWESGLQQSVLLEVNDSEPRADMAQPLQEATSDSRFLQSSQMSERHDQDGTKEPTPAEQHGREAVEQIAVEVNEKSNSGEDKAAETETGQGHSWGQDTIGAPLHDADRAGNLFEGDRVHGAADASKAADFAELQTPEHQSQQHEMAATDYDQYLKKDAARTDSERLRPSQVHPSREVVQAAILSAVLEFQPSLEQLAVRLQALVEDRLPSDSQANRVETLLRRWGHDQEHNPSKPSKACLAILLRDLRYSDGPSPSALDISVKDCNYPVTSVLLRHVPVDLDGHLINVLNGHNPFTGQSLLYAAVRYSNRYTAGVVDELLQRRVDINGAGKAPPQSEMMIVSCVQRADLPLIERVLSYRADINAKSADGKPLLQMAVERGCAEILSALLSNPGCEVNATNACGRTALVSALRTARPPFTLAQQLLAAHCDASKPDVSGVQPLLHTASIPEPGIHALLLEFRADPDAVASPGTDAQARLLHVAAQAKNETLLKCLLDAGAEPNAPESFGRSVLHLAVSLNLSREAIAAILSAQGDPNLLAGQGSGGETPLRLAILAESPALDLLLAARANPNGRNLAGCTALQAAFCAGSGGADSLKMCELLMAWRADPQSQRRTLLTSQESSYMSSLSRTMPTMPPVIAMQTVSSQITAVTHPKYFADTWSKARFRPRRTARHEPGEEIEDFDPLFPLRLPPVDRKDFNRTFPPRREKLL